MESRVADYTANAVRELFERLDVQTLAIEPRASTENLGMNN